RTIQNLSRQPLKEREQKGMEEQEICLAQQTHQWDLRMHNASTCAWHGAFFLRHPAVPPNGYAIRVTVLFSGQLMDLLLAEKVVYSGH
ncbi:hypothetical protein AVEN_39309-1, partial [Araneus ventricosus]